MALLRSIFKGLRRWSDTGCLLAGPALDEEFNTAVERLLLFRREITGRQFIALAVIMKALAAQGVLAARVRAGAVFGIDCDSWTLVKLAHVEPPGVAASSFF